MKTAILVLAGMITSLSVAWNRDIQDAAKPVAFEELSLHLEVDLPAAHSHSVLPRSLLELPAEVVLEASALQGLARLRLVDREERTVLQLDCSQAMALGVSDLSLETEGVTLGAILREYRLGRYHVEGTTIDGRRVEGTLELSDRFPGLFRVLSPLPGEAPAAGDVTIAWTPARGAARYVLEVEQDELGIVFETRLAPGQTSFIVPAQLLVPGEIYEYSLLVQGDTDNELEIEGSFRTAVREATHASRR